MFKVIQAITSDLQDELNAAYDAGYRMLVSHQTTIDQSGLVFHTVILKKAAV